MKQLLFLILFSIGLTINAQVPFQDVINFYKNNNDKILTKEIAIEYFGFDTITPHWSLPICRGIKYETDQIITLVSESECPAGGLCKMKSIDYFTPEGHLINFEIGHNYADCSFHNELSLIDFKLHLITLKLKKQKLDCDLDSITKQDISIIQISLDSSFNTVSEDTLIIDTRRPYYFVSTQVLTPKDLTKYDNKELSNMRNEIYASHGLVFKSFKWHDYFQQQSWYRGNSGNVSHKLTWIEQHNVKLFTETRMK